MIRMYFVLSITLFLVGQGVLAQRADRTFFKAGFHAGLPIGDAADVSSFSLGLDLYQHWGISRVFDLGIASGFTNAFGKTIETASAFGTIQTEFDNVQFVPLAVLVRAYPSRKFNLGGDIGYAFGINQGNSGGFYYRPTAAIDLGPATQLNVSYTGISSDGGHWTTITGGIIFLF